MGERSAVDPGGNVDKPLTTASDTSLPPIPCEVAALGHTFAFRHSMGAQAQEQNFATKLFYPRTGIFLHKGLQ